MPNVFHTGKDDDARAGAFFAYRGDKVSVCVYACMCICVCVCLCGTPGASHCIPFLPVARRPLSLSRTHTQNIANIWPGGTIPFAGALKGLPGSVQYGYSDGLQFPPFNAIDQPDTVLSVFVPGFVLPLKFVYEKDVTVQGVYLKR